MPADNISTHVPWQPSFYTPVEEISDVKENTVMSNSMNIKCHQQPICSPDIHNTAVRKRMYKETPENTTADKCRDVGWAWMASPGIR